MSDELLAPDVALSGEYDVEDVVHAMPSENRLKGMFFARFSRDLGDGWRNIQSTLDQPPKFGRYVAFTDYPQRDFVRLYTAVAKKRFPTLPLCEAIRRLGRDDVNVFAESMVGGVMVAMVGDARSALSKLPLAYAATIRSAMKVSVEQLDDFIRVTFKPHFGRWEYQLGQLEGVLAAFGSRSRIRTHEDGSARVFEVHLS